MEEYDYIPWRKESNVNTRGDDCIVTGSITYSTRYEPLGAEELKAIGATNCFKSCLPILRKLRLLQYSGILEDVLPGLDEDFTHLETELLSSGVDVECIKKLNEI